MRRVWALAIAGLFTIAPAWAQSVDLGVKTAGEAVTAAPYTGSDVIPLVRGTAWGKIVATILNPCTATLVGTVPTPPNDATKFLNGQCAWTTPAGGGGITIGSTSITGGTTGRLLYDNAGNVGEMSTLTAALFPALTGDVTTAGRHFATALANLAVTTAKLNTAAVTYAKIQNGASAGLLGVNNGSAPTEVAVGTGLSLLAGTLSATGGGAAAGVGVQTGQSPSNIGDNATALPSGHYYYATNANMTAQRTHNLPDSATQGVGDLEVFDAQQTATATNQLCVQAAGTDKVNTVTNGTVCITTAGGSIYLHNDAAGNYTTGAASNIPQPTNGQIIVGKTGSPANSLAAVTPSQDCTMTNAGVFTCLKTNNVSFGALSTVVAGTGVATAAAANLSAAGGFTTTIASGAKALATTAISSAACTAAQTAAATNTLTTDVVTASFNGDPTAVTGYVPLTSGMLTIIAYPTADTVNFKVCNNTSGSITPGAITLNWRVAR
jgi:hypothetical protein